MFDRISVWLDERTPDEAVLAQGREWAGRLHCPFHSVAPPQVAAANPAAAGQGEGGNGTVAVAVAPAAPLVAEPQRGELCVLGRSLPKGLRNSLFHRSARAGAGLLVCPDEWQPLSRALVLHEDDCDESFLRSAARLCERLQSRVVVLSVAHSDRGTARRSRQAAEVFGGFELDCVFDELIGLDTADAVLHVAGWRRCQVVMTQRRPGRRWWPWHSHDTFEQLAGRPADLALLALPEQRSSDS